MGVYELMSISDKSAFKNATWIVACNIAQSLVAFVIGTISARYLGPSNYGLISYASSLIAFVVPLAQLGLRNVLVEQIVSHPEREGKTVGTSLLMSMTASFFCIVGCISFTLIANAGERDAVIVCALYSISLVFQMSKMIEYWYQAKLLSKYTSIVSLAAYAVVSSYKVFLLITEKSIYWFAVTNAFDYLLISVALIVLYRKLSDQKLSFSFALAKELFSVSKYYIVSGMMVTVFSQTDRIMIKMMIGNAETGYYSTAATCAGLSSFIFGAIIDSMRPLIFESKKNGRDLFENKVSQLYSIVIYLALFQSIAFVVLARPVIMIMYGEAYAASIPILQTITWYSAFSYMGSVRNIWILAEGQQKYLWIVNLSGAVLNVIGNFILIPLCGAIGAAIASVITQFFTNFILSLIMKPLKPTAKLIWKALDPRTVISMIPKRR